MTHRVGIVVIAFLTAGFLLTAIAPAQQADRRSEVVRALLRHSRPLSGAHVEIPAGLYHRYLRDLHAPERSRPEAPVPYIAESGTYHLTVGAEGQTTLKAKVRLRVFDPQKCLNIPILSAKKVVWEDLSADNEGAILTTTDGWVRFSASKPGLYTIAGLLRLKTAEKSGGTVNLDIAQTVRATVVFDSPGMWEVQAEGYAGTGLTGTTEKGTHGLFALKPTNRLRIKYSRPMPRRQRPSRYTLRGDVAWNLDAGAQQITASLTATIAAGKSDRIVLLLPDEADRVEITGPEVRRVQVGSGRAVVYLRGQILGQTVLKVSCELPAGRGGKCRLGRFGVADGRWSGGTLVVTNSAGGSEILPASMTGLREMSLAEVPPSASAILPAPAVLAYEITSREFSAEVEVLQLGRFALRQSIVDLAHYEVFLARDGSVICRARYEIRNSNKQFLRLKLPDGAQVLMARVNEKSRPISPAMGNKNTWLLPLERSRASVMGLVSFPVEVVFLCRTVPVLAKGVAEIPLPGIDLPIAYAWCETYVPADMGVEKWSGVMRKVARFSSETATASLDYGWGELAEGYTGMDRPTIPPASKPGVGLVGGLFKPPAHPMTPTDRTTTRPAASQPSSVPIISRIPILTRTVTTRSATPILAKNYYRAGKDYYDKGDYAGAARYLEQVAKLAPGSAEARNAKRLLANPQMPKARKAETKAEKAAARVVEREVAESNIMLERQQRAYIQSGKAAAREGRHREATAKLKAAQTATEQLIARGADRRETLARMRKAQPEMMKLRKQATAEVSRLRGRMSELKKSGEYEKALKTASELRRYADELTPGETLAPESSRVAGLRRKESQELQKEMDALAAAASKQMRKEVKQLSDIRRSQVPRHVLMNYPEDWPGLTLRRKPKPGMPTTAPSRKGTGPITMVYDIRDLVVRTPNFQGPNINLRTTGNNNAAGWAWGDDDDEDAPSGQESTGDIVDLIRSTIDPETWREAGGEHGSIREMGGQIIVTNTAENQKALTNLLVQLRQARGPQVEEGEKIAQQRAAGKAVDDTIVDVVTDALQPHAAMRSGEGIQIKDKELDEFIRRNYDWALQDRKQKDLTTTVTVPDGGTLLIGGQAVDVSGLVSKLRFNLSQKVVVNSLNVNADASAAAALGVRFDRGNNNVNWAVINEAQFRSLMELDAELTRRGGRAVESNERLQETIVGTDAHLSNAMGANIAFAGDKGNTMAINGNAINLSHEGYLIIDNGGYLTVVRAGAMQHWREKPTGAGFVEVPQNIEVPRVGQLFRFERTLLEPSDQMVLRVEYKLEGVSK